MFLSRLPTRDFTVCFFDSFCGKIIMLFCKNNDIIEEKTKEFFDYVYLQFAFYVSAEAQF